MKTVLAVLGVIGIVLVLAIGGGAFYAYKKGSSAILKAGQDDVNTFISTKHPSEEVARSLHRLINGVKLNPSWKSTALVATIMPCLQDGVVTGAEQKMIDDAATQLEQGQITKQSLADFVKKYENLMPRRTRPAVPS